MDCLVHPNFWYLKPVKIGVKRVKPAVENLKNAINKIDDEMIKNWIFDLVINKTAEGLIIQEIILKHLSKK
ncbi:MjaI family restriction endonuclease, partial [archaeon]|nr:MjaI family restriction endonuclease [archaeon]